ncbi:helix-turn-helix transcriptional regulator [Halodurantibacterium flavum]|uniref:Helix-turn-helix transcriptional regulator n=1 Tax=Halodurantibacterium flavum TaxID=1382802 RepID=A0ABW4S502_9RHOB
MDRRNDLLLVTAFADTLRETRQAASLAQEDLAERADVSARFISFLETGKRQPSLSAARRRWAPGEFSSGAHVMSIFPRYPSRTDRRRRRSGGLTDKAARGSGPPAPWPWWSSR